MYSDASGSFGCGAFDHSYGWFQLQWPQHWSAVDIAIKEFVPVVIVAALWGSMWEGRHVCFCSDNMAVVSILNKYMAKVQLLNYFLRCLFFYASFYKFYFSAAHIPGTFNTAADALSRNNLTAFSLLFPQVPQVEVQATVQDLLVWEMPDWISPRWTNLFSLSL